MTKYKAKLQDIHLRNGIELTVDWNSKMVCRCGVEIWWGRTKNHKFMPIELVGLAEWDSHFATCPYAKEFRHQR